MARETDKLLEDQKSKAREERALAVERDHQVRLRSVANDTRLNLPVSIALPDGEECGTHFQIRCYDQHAEIQKNYIQGPPNKTICNSSEWRDWETGDVRSSRDTKSSSKGQLFGLKLSTSGKSPTSHSSRPRDHQRHSHPTNSKNPTSTSSSKHKNSGSSSSSSTCSSTSSSTSSCTGLGLGGFLAPKFSSSGQSISEKLHTVSEKLYHVGDGSSGGGGRTNPNNNSSSSGVLSRFIDETKFRTRSNSKGSSSSGSDRASKKQQQQQNMIVGNPNGSSGKLTSLTTTSTMTTRSSTSTMTMLKCDASVKERPIKSSTTHQSETFSERVQQGESLVQLGGMIGGPSPAVPPETRKCTSGSDNNGNAGVSPPSPCLMLGAASTATASSCVSMPPPMTKTDDSNEKQWNPLRAADGVRRLGEIDSFSQNSVQNVGSELIPRTTLFSSASDVVVADCYHHHHQHQHQHQHQTLQHQLPTPPQVKDSSSTSSPHFVSQQQQQQQLQPDQYSLASADVELLDQRH